MKYLITVVFALLLAGCGQTIVIKPDFPPAPAEVLAPCEPLQLLKDPSKLSDVSRTVAANYTLYHECKSKHGEFVRWYKLQEENYNKKGP